MRDRRVPIPRASLDRLAGDHATRGGVACTIIALTIRCSRRGAGARTDQIACDEFLGQDAHATEIEGEGGASTGQVLEINGGAIT